MASQFTTSLVQQTLKRKALLGQAALQSSSAQVQLSSQILYARTLAGEQLLQHAFCLFAKGFLCELLRQFGLKLRRHRGQQISVVSDKGKIHI